jgi:quercetin dioxygenase-like cupin family protein
LTSPTRTDPWRDMRVLKETEDRRGKIVWLVSDEKEIHIVETKKGFSRGGHYHPFDSTHMLVSGEIVYRECNMQGGQETSKTAAGITTIFTPANRAHMISALTDSIFIEVFDQPYSATEFERYRKIVNDAMQSRV